MDWIEKITRVIASLLSSHAPERCLSGSPMGSSHHRSASDSLSKPRPPISHLMKCLRQLRTCVLRHMASELNLKMRKDELNLRNVNNLRPVHVMLSQMDIALVSYCEKIAENRGPLTLPEKIGGSVHVAQMETTMTRDIKLNRGIHDALASEEAFFQSLTVGPNCEKTPKDAAQLALKKMPSAEQETISMSEYQRGVGAWNFDLEDLKFKASLVQDDDEIQDIRDHDVDSTSFANNEASNSKATTIGKHSTSNIESRSMFMLQVLFTKYS
ncbi:unnamed protein product [Lactuca saligna]|uniref:Uncharacterized protein n=1 Tax=Lactuca saligna TaxID=75948 RepID=A0AA35YM92_LACSI|nr:unnamed protein product [Lactuca saligna]